MLVIVLLVDDYLQVQVWLGWVFGFGYGVLVEMSVEEVLEVVCGSQFVVLLDEFFSDFNGFLFGQVVVIVVIDYGVDVVQGELFFVGSEEFILCCEDLWVGIVYVYFLCLGFCIEVC